jgi:hypothetical protein
MKAVERFNFIIDLDFVKPCKCQFCRYIIPSNRIYGFFCFSGTSIYLGLTFLGEAAAINYYVNGCPYGSKIYSTDFESVLDNLPADIQSKVIYNLNLFR